jgi:Flp pilus assembly protein TadD
MGKIRQKANGMILTDDYAPVENLLASVVSENTRQNRADRHIKSAEKFEKQGDLDKAMAEYKKILKIDPGTSIKAYNNMAVIQMQRGELKDATESLKKAIELNENTGLKDNLAAVHLNLGVVLSNLNEPNQSMAHLREAEKGFREMLRQNPTAASLWSDLGNTLAEIGDFNEASKAFGEAVKLEPGNPMHYESLALSLEFQNRYDEVNEQLVKGIRFMEEHGQQDDADKLRKYLEIAESRRTKLKK